MNALYTRLEVFADLMGCFGNLYFWRYDPSMTLVDSNCPDAEYWDEVFHRSSCRVTALEHCQQKNIPILLSDPIGLIWMVGPIWEQAELTNVFLLGPICLSPPSKNQLEKLLSSAISYKERTGFIQRLEQLPIMVHTRFMMLGVMMHYCLTGERISVSDISIPETATAATDLSAHGKLTKEYHGGEEYEQLMLKLIEEGNLNYRNLLPPQTGFRVGTLAHGDSLRQFKNEIIVSTTLCCRAAIRGGIARELALTLSDYYIQAVENAATISELADINYTMRDDYTRRVHNHRQQGEHSAAVKSCIEVIDRHITERLNIAQIAEETGYAGYYISSLFKKEMQVSVKDYIKQKKIEYAKVLLMSSKDDIATIADQLGFSSSSHFGSVFRALSGMTPKEYRESAHDKRVRIHP